MNQYGDLIVSLVGEQPIPVLLPLLAGRYGMALMAHTEQTRRQAERLRRILANKLQVELLQVHAYRIEDTQQALDRWVRQAGLPAERVWFNLTGGTKPMMLAAFALAARRGIGFLYLESEGGQSVLYHYRVDEGGRVQELDQQTLPPLLDIRTYLDAHVDDAQIVGMGKTQGAQLEAAVAKALEGHVDEVACGVRMGGGNIDIDLAVRYGNQVGIIEVKGGKVNKQAIDQLNTAGGREYLGTYTRKFWVRARSAGSTARTLDELATARSIIVIELPSYLETGQISPEDSQKLVTKIRKGLTGQL
jgi:hypothetical protein